MLQPCSTASFAVLQGSTLQCRQDLGEQRNHLSLTQHLHNIWNRPAYWYLCANRPFHLISTLPFYGGEKTNTNSSITFTFTILQAFPLCKAYMLGFGQVHPYSFSHFLRGSLKDELVHSNFMIWRVLEEIMISSIGISSGASIFFTHLGYFLGG